MAATMSALSFALPEDTAFSSVFPTMSFTTATPETTPLIGTIGSPKQRLGADLKASNSAADRAVELSRAWSVATRFLTLSAVPDGNTIAQERQSLQALLLILEHSESSARDLVDWYMHEIGVHYRSYVLPNLRPWLSPVPLAEADALVRRTISALREARDYYLGRLQMPSGLSSTSMELMQAFVREVNRKVGMLFLHSLPSQRLQATLTRIMFEGMQTALVGGGNPEKCVKDDSCHCSMSADGMPLVELCEVGLGGQLGERAFGDALHSFLSGPAVERRCFQVDWNGHSSVVERVRVWVEKHLTSFVQEALRRLTGDATFELPWQDMRQLDVMAIASIGRLRTASLFDYVKTWPDSTGAILDIRAYINIKDYVGAGGATEKAYVCQSFINQTQKRLLHAGASTSEILSIYVNVIHAFKAMDARGVLLGKVAIPIRTYLRARDDTAGIVAASFLADLDQDGRAPASDVDKVCVDIADEVAHSALHDGRDYRMLNWNDMKWLPDPLDAGPDFTSSRSDDVVANILGLFEQEEFIKEVTAVLAQVLLYNTETEYIKETRLVELLKSRLDATKLQAIEVMLQDVRESISLGRRINPSAAAMSSNAAVPTPKDISEAIPEQGISVSALYSVFASRLKRAEFLAMAKIVSHRRNDLLFPKRTRLPLQTSHPSEDEGRTAFKAQVLSSFFWPQLRADEFTMPAAFASRCEHFSRRFRDFGGQRKLHFRPALARVSLRLELEDRIVEEKDLAGWRASVIDAFAARLPGADDAMAPETTDPVCLTAEDLMRLLGMEEELVQDALTFWISKRVLYQPSTNVYAVLERLDLDVGGPETAVADILPPHDEVSAVRSQDAVFRDAAPMFQAFVANMLRIHGAKSIDGPMGITALLRMVNPMFTYGDDEVRWLLAEMEGRGEVFKNGEAWTATAPP